MNIKLPFDRDGCKIAGIMAVIAVCLGSIGTNMGWIGFLVMVGCLAFFRDPERVHPSISSAVVSPADGVVLKVLSCTPPEELGLSGEWRKISVFMSIFNVHVNRAPIAGVVEKILYIPGRFFNVTLDKASEYNERQATFIRMADGTLIVFVQIAGLLARRIRSDIVEKQELELGQRVGIIRFGSRVDIYLPNDAKILIEEGQVTVAGESVLAKLKEEGTKNGKEYLKKQ